MNKYAIIALSLLGSSLVFSSPVDATTGFEAGRIIDNSVFTDAQSMKVSDIQNFLNSKAPSCDTWGAQTSEFGGGTRAEWGAAHNNPAPFICLKDYSENGISSAQIIYNLSQQYLINPQVLIVLLQKEQGLVTDTWPLASQYKTATGYGCPDTAACDSQYFGLTNQLTWSAKMFRAIMNSSPGWYTPYVLGNNTIQYNPQSSCGSSVVNIQNLATQALYNYTPYQPNQSALDAGYGTGNSCGAYGNRNFYLYFTDWFGLTKAADYAWQLVSQEAYVDAGMTKPANLDKLSPSTTYYFRIKARNSGNTTWSNSGAHPVLLGTNSPPNRSSVLCNDTWTNCGRPALLKEASVSPESTGTFIFSVTTPTGYGTYREYFNIVAEGKSWFTDIGMYLTPTVTPPSPEWAALSQEIYTDASRTKPANVNTLAPNTSYYATIKSRNSGNTTWSNVGANPVRLATNSPPDRQSQFYDNSWLSGNRPTALKETSVAPGDTGTFEFVLKTSASYGNLNEYFRPVVEGSVWMNDIGFYWPLTVVVPTPQWSVTSQQTYTDSTKTTSYKTSATTNKARVFMSIRARNTGNTTWLNTGANPVMLGTSSPADRTSEFYDSSWINANRPARLKESSVAPGEIGTFEFWLTSPYKLNGTSINEYFRAVVEGSAWMNDVGMYQPFTFSTADASWEYVGQGSYSDSAYTMAANLSNSSRNTIYYLRLRAKNTGGLIWKPSTVLLGTSSPADRTSLFYNTGWVGNNRATRLKESSIAPGGTGTFEFTIKTPTSAISSNEYFRPVIEGATWLTDVGLFWNIGVN
ncbi:hypothetical protein H7X68_00840 [Candidatus Saccharibacteria bacterium]|nr:hypothetical protein [Candidatus Saccharibacteria bacterium]